MRVIVAGAGLAGLCAARELARGGAAVTLIDARERAGGRVWTERFDNGQPAELGGEFIDKGQKEICGLIGELGLELVRVLRSGFTHRFRGSDGHYQVSRTRPWDELARSLEPLIARYKAERGDPSSEPVREMATFSLRAWLREHDAPRELHSMADGLRGFFLADPHELSVLPVVAQIAGSGSPAQKEMYRIQGGTDRLVAALVAAGCGRLLLSHPLRAIAHATDRVLFDVEDERGRAQQLEADAAVLALPAPALADVEIRPPLPEAQRRAFARLLYGCATKVVVQSPRDLFGGHRARAFATDMDLGAFWDGADGDSGRGTVVNFLGGASASRRLRRRADEGARGVLEDLCWLGMANAPVTGIRVATWEDDPWARGGYAYFDPGYDPAWRPLLAQRSGRLVFAGEHTSREWQGYMNGAVESGLRAARQLLENRPQ